MTSRTAPGPSRRSAAAPSGTRSAPTCSRGSSRADPLFPGIVGYEDTVLPQIVNALLARHDFILLGLRGQAKSRILRELTGLLDERIPIVAGSEVNDDPFAPISKYARELLAECGDATPIAWLGRDQRFVEKLATPDVTIADIIGDVDPIKAARGGHLLSDELTMHFGLLPRANRGIFAINELPDLSGKIQVGLFNIMQEGDVQIKGYPVRLPLDVLLVLHRQSRGLHRARQDHHAAQGPHRLGDHHPLSAHGRARHGDHRAGSVDRARRASRLDVPDFVLEVIERIAFEAREDKRVDKRSGVSQRLPISVLENAVSNAERRAVALGEDRVVPRISDVYAALPSITGKLELEYEGELQGGDAIARELIRRAAGRGDGGPDGRRRPRRRSSPGSTRAARSRSRATSAPSSASRASRGAGTGRRWSREFGLADARRHRARRRRLRAGAGGPGRPEADQPQRGAGLYPGKPERREPGVREGRDLVRVKRDGRGQVNKLATLIEPTRSVPVTDCPASPPPRFAPP